MTGTLVGPSSAADRAFCDTILPKVSRTFAICIRLLPSHIEHPVLVAYLLCRIADTIEDTPDIPPPEKDRLFEHFGRCLEAAGPDAELLSARFTDPVNDEQLLAREADAVLREFRRLPPPQQDAIRPWVQEMSSGMAEFVRRTEDGTHLASLATVEELDRYCYYVAGTVGHLLTRLFRLHDSSADPERYDRLDALATSFGLGLQLTNIIKDVADDRRRGWSFVPRQLCDAVGIEPEELQDESHRDEGRRVMRLLIEKAKGHLDDALRYSTTLPRRQYGIRLFCMSSLFFAVRTLHLAERDPRLLDPAHKVKITRGQVYRTLATARLIASSNLLVRAYFRHLAGAAWRRPLAEQAQLPPGSDRR
ncbi:MAG: phytoene/squalene synthase family protein [Gemmatimonadota bacterium]|nr:MAG: phytoene/squalene synthase family protein [Gemmatimonadota bacterium]